MKRAQISSNQLLKGMNRHLYGQNFVTSEMRRKMQMVSPCAVVGISAAC